MKKKVSEIQKKQIKELFLKGESIQELSNIFQFSIQTITRQLKIIMGENTFKEFKKNLSNKKQNNKLSNKLIENNLFIEENINFKEAKQDDNYINLNDSVEQQNFFEILPVLEDINLDKQKDLSSEHISEVDLPQTVYMIVDKKIELEIKLLKDYPDWEFLPKDDLNRKTIEIYFDIKIAKRLCNKEQRVIKVPNTDVFRITAPILLSRGISRIVSVDKLIAL